jgi:hypothetical protein
MQPVTLITGASAGIGAELARVFAQHGDQVVLAARREAKMQALAGDIAAAGYLRPYVIAADLEAAGGPDRLAQAMAALALEPAVVVNNAGFGLSGDAAELDIDQQLRMIDLNTRALTDLSLRFIDSLARHRGGILNVASIAGFVPGPGLAVYHATKAFVVSFSEALHQELKGRGVRVSALCPGPVPTEFQARAGIARGKTPSLLERSALRVAQDGYRGFMRGDRLIVPGFYNKVVMMAARLLPARLLLAIAARRNQQPPRPGR